MAGGAGDRVRTRTICFQDRLYGAVAGDDGNGDSVALGRAGLKCCTGRLFRQFEWQIRCGRQRLRQGDRRSEQSGNNEKVADHEKVLLLDEDCSLSGWR